MKPLTAASVQVLLLATATTSFKLEVENPKPPHPYTSIIQNETRFVKSQNGPVTRSFIADFMDGRPIPEEVDGKFFDGDMILTTKQRRPLEERGFKQYPENPLLDFWPPAPQSNEPYPVVPYVFDSSIEPVCINVIKDCIAHWEANTCITFQETTNFNQPRIIFIMAEFSGGYFGRVNSNNGQEIKIGPSCNKLSVLRVIGKSLLYGYEEIRPDRDNYIHINMENLSSDQQTLFDINYNTIVHFKYDYTSFFHDYFRGGTKNGLPTISTLDPLDNYLLKAESRLTFRDKFIGISMYNCTSMWESKCSTTSTTCLNEGYTGANCSCVCPPNFSGDNCENQIRESYYAPPTDGCTQRVTTEKNLFAPNMSADVSDELQCAIEIIAPQGMKPRLTFNTFNLQPRATCTEGDCCYYENLQFRENYPESSTAYCATDISSGNEFTFDSQQVVIFHYRDSTVTSCGWSADLTFVSDPNCIPTDGGCTLEFNEISTYNWKSPGFDGTTEYPICSTCTQDMTGMPNTMLYFTSQSFNVGTQPVDGECTDDYIQINHLYGRSEKFCGSDPIYFTSPSSSFSLEFHSNYITPATGFDITMKMASYCAIDCHQEIQLMSQETYTIESPDFKNKIFPNLNCEYNFIAPEGKQIEIKKLVTKVKANTDCTSNFLLVNGDGDRRYPMDTSTIICDYDTRNNCLTTNTNNLLVAYQKTGLDSKGFKMVIMVT